MKLLPLLIVAMALAYFSAPLWVWFVALVALGAVFLHINILY